MATKEEQLEILRNIVAPSNCHQLLINKLFNYINLKNETDFGEYTLMLLNFWLFDDGEMYINCINVSEDENKVDVHFQGVEICTVPRNSTFTYYQKEGLWIAVEDPGDEYPHILVLDFSMYTLTLFEILYNNLDLE